MIKNLFSLIVCVFFIQFSFAQPIDTATYLHLAGANKEEFLNYAKSNGMAIDFNARSQSLFAKTKDCLYTKPLDNRTNDGQYVLALIVSTQDKKNSKLILRNAKELHDDKDRGRTINICTGN